MNIRNVKDYAYFEYPEYLRETTNSPYKVGDVVYIKNSNSIGVVLGCIDTTWEELRTDAEGMQSFSDLELATIAHIKKDGVSIGNKLKIELMSNNYES